MLNYLTTTRTYHDNDILYEADLNNIAQSIMTFLNTTLLNSDNLSTSITGGFASSGFIMMYGDSTAPSGWLNCDGSVVSQTTYAALYAVVGSTYNTGSEGAGNFRLPDYRRRAPVGKGGTGTATLGNALGNTGGEETHTLVTGEMASHSHGDTPGHSHLQRYATNAGSNDVFNLASTFSSTATASPTSTDSTDVTYLTAGNDQPHNNMQPSLVMNFIIKV